MSEQAESKDDLLLTHSTYLSQNKLYYVKQIQRKKEQKIKSHPSILMQEEDLSRFTLNI